MALAYDGAIQRLIDAFANLPGIGPKGAQRIAFYLLNAPDEESQALIDAITEVKEKVRFCDICGNVCETSPCPVCADPRRDHSVICVVEEPKDVMSIERTREYRGMYHVLGGVINPMANVQPSDLNIAKLIERLKDSEVTEVILALNPNVEGEATTSFLSQLLSQTDIKVTRLASGLPVGGDLEYADEIIHVQEDLSEKTIFLNPEALVKLAETVGHKRGYLYAITYLIDVAEGGHTEPETPEE